MEIGERMNVEWEKWRRKKGKGRGENRKIGKREKGK